MTQDFSLGGTILDWDRRVNENGKRTPFRNQSAQIENEHNARRKLREGIKGAEPGRSMTSVRPYGQDREEPFGSPRLGLYVWRIWRIRGGPPKTLPRESMECSLRQILTEHIENS